VEVDLGIERECEKTTASAVAPLIRRLETLSLGQQSLEESRARGLLLNENEAHPPGPSGS
jgi:hypothetical protein